MMYRSGWASKRNQERILSVRISREGFKEILAKAYTAKVSYSLIIFNVHYSIKVCILTMFFSGLFMKLLKLSL